MSLIKLQNVYKIYGEGQENQVNGIAAQADRRVRMMDGKIVHDSLADREGAAV